MDTEPTTAHPRSADQDDRSARAGRVAQLESIVQGSVGLTARVVGSAAPELTLLQWRTIVVISDRPGGVSIAELSSRIGATSSATSRLVSRLVARELVETRKSLPDRRVTRVVLSDGGAALRRRVQRDRRRLLEPIAARLSDADLAIFAEALRSFE